MYFNGIGANLELARPFVTAMTELGFGVIVFDVPGVGESETPAGPYRLADVARLAGRVLDAVGVRGLVHVAGVSWGGALAQQFAHENPARTRSLSLFATSAGAAAFPGRLAAVARLMTPRRYADARYMREIGGDLYGGSFRTDRGVLDAYAAHTMEPNPIGYWYQLLASTGWSSASWLPSITAPAIVVMGTDDPIMPVVNGKILASLIPNARLYTIDDGHLFVVTRMASLGPLLADFLRAADRADRDATAEALPSAS